MTEIDKERKFRMLNSISCSKMTDSQITALICLGFKRWQKYGKDRLYINPETLGVEFHYYNSGNISGCWIGEECVSNSEGRRIKGTKTYIDLTSNRICIDGPCRDEYREHAQERIEEMIADVVKGDSDGERG